MKRYFLLIYVALAFLMLWSCKSPNSPEPPDDPQEQFTSLSGKVTDVDNGNPISGATVEFPKVTATTDANGNYSVSVLEGTVTNASTVIISKEGFKTYSTYIGHGLDYKLVPDNYDSDTFNIVMRGGGISQGHTKIWLQQPKYKIVTTNLDETIKSYFTSVLKSDAVSLLTNNTWIGTSQPEEGTSEPASNSFYILLEFVDLGLGSSVMHVPIDYKSQTYEITRARIRVNTSKIQYVSSAGILHELGHALGHTGHSNKHQMLMGGQGFMVGNITQLDIQNAKWAYTRPPGNEAPDNDIQPTGTTTGFMSAPSFNVPSLNFNPFKFPQRNSIEPKQRIITKRKKKDPSY